MEAVAEAASVTRQHRVSRRITQMLISGPARWRCSPCHSAVDRAACAFNCRCDHLRVLHPRRTRLCRAPNESQQCPRCRAAWSSGMAARHRCHSCAPLSHSALAPALCTSCLMMTAEQAMKTETEMDMASAVSAARLHRAKPDARDSSSSDTRSHPSPTRSDCRRILPSAKSRKAKRNSSPRPRRWLPHFASTFLRPRQPQMALHQRQIRARRLSQRAMARMQALLQRPSAGIARNG